ncbi:hypothetical protein SAMN05518856_111196 [Paenibacillus sp. OK003]|nr:hypothetical protein SAMN05518856_111196 [Paenibacillus sp. OK003]
MDSVCVEFFEKNSPIDQIVTPILDSVHLSTITNKADSLWLDSKLYLLLQNMITLHNLEMVKINAL